MSAGCFHPLKTELMHQEQFKTNDEAKQTIYESIKVFYNRERSHSENDELSPVEYKNQFKAV